MPRASANWATAFPTAAAACRAFATSSSRSRSTPRSSRARKVAPDVVTMNSTVSFRDEPTGLDSRVTLVYPAEVAIAERRISVLSPVGRALLGRAVGAVAEVELPDGGTRPIRVLEIHYQPEASGDFNR